MDEDDSLQLDEDLRDALEAAKDCLESYDTICGPGRIVQRILDPLSVGRQFNIIDTYRLYSLSEQHLFDTEILDEIKWARSKYTDRYCPDAYFGEGILHADRITFDSSAYFICVLMCEFAALALDFTEPLFSEGDVTSHDEEIDKVNPMDGPNAEYLLGRMSCLPRINVEEVSREVEREMYAVAMLRNSGNSWTQLGSELCKEKETVKKTTKAATPRLMVSRNPCQVILDGNPYAITATAADFLYALIEAQGEWVSGARLKIRPDRIKPGLDPCVRNLIEAQDGKGHRIPRKKLEELGLIL